MRDTRHSQARRDALALVTDPGRAAAASQAIRQTAWNILVSERGGAAVQRRRDPGTGDAA